MPVKKYSLAEIDTMRRAVHDLMASCFYYELGYTSVAPKAADVEEQLRTYMANGTAPEELVEEVKRRHKAGAEQARKWVEVDRTAPYSGY